MRDHEGELDIWTYRPQREEASIKLFLRCHGREGFPVRDVVSYLQCTHPRCEFRKSRAYDTDRLGFGVVIIDSSIFTATPLPGIAQRREHKTLQGLQNSWGGSGFCDVDAPLNFAIIGVFVRRASWGRDPGYHSLFQVKEEIGVREDHGGAFKCGNERCLVIEVAFNNLDSFYGQSLGGFTGWVACNTSNFSS